MKIIGIILITIGIGLLVFRGYSFSKNERLSKTGSTVIRKKMEEKVIWPQYAGAFAMAVGVFILIGRNKLREE